MSSISIVSGRGYQTPLSDRSSSRGPYPNHPPSGSTPTTAGSLSTDNEPIEQTILAVVQKSKGTLGCAYYSSADEHLYVMQPLESAGGGSGPGAVDDLDMLVTSVDPTVVLVSSRADDGLLARLDPQFYSVGDRGERSVSDSESADMSTVARQYVLRIQPASTFYPPRAAEALADVFRGVQMERGPVGDPEGCLDEVTLRLGHILEGENGVSIGCAGAIIEYLKQRQLSGRLERSEDGEEQIEYAFKSVKLFSIKSQMYINSDTIHSLQIMGTQTNPHFHNQGPAKATSRGKEDFSVYGLFRRYAKTPQGKALLRKTFLQPSVDRGQLEDRLDAVALFTLPENSEAVKQLTQHLRLVKNIRMLLTKMQQGSVVNKNVIASLSKNTWDVLRDFCHSAAAIWDIIVGAIHAPPWQFSRMASVITAIRDKFDKSVLLHLLREINTIVEFEHSGNEQHCAVKDGVDEALDRWKAVFMQLPQILDQARIALEPTIPADMPYVSVDMVYIPRIGFRARFLFEADVEPPELVIPSDGDGEWELEFRAGPYAFYTTSISKELDEELGDVAVHISNREIEILQKLAEVALTFLPLLVEISDLCGQLDVVLVMAQAAVAYGLCRPQITEESVIDVVGGRHILQELVVPSFVKNPTKLAAGGGASHGPGPAILIMTGPNFSGKSIYLKQVAIIVYLAHIGSFVPADEATIGITTHILTRITTRESVSKQVSAFLIDLQQISFMLSHAGPRSLLLVDEFGKGTDNYSGAGLFAGLTKHFLSRGSECPRTIMSTHFHEIFEGNCLSLTPATERLLAFGHMQVLIEGAIADAAGSEARQRLGKFQIDSRVTYVYRFSEGRSAVSLGIQCALLHGVPRAVIERAATLSRLLLTSGDLVTACAVPSSRVLADRERAEGIAAERLAERFVRTDWEVVGVAEVKAVLLEMVGAKE